MGGIAPTKLPSRVLGRAMTKKTKNSKGASSAQLSAHQVFSLNTSRLLHLLQAGSTGIRTEKEKFEELHRKFSAPLIDGSNTENQSSRLRPSLRRKRMEKLRDAFDIPTEEIEAAAAGPLASNPKFTKHDDGTMSVSLDRVDAELLVETMSAYAEFIGELDCDFHNILCVAAWGAFEGYVQSVLFEVFSSHPDLLASEKTMTTREIIEKRDVLIEHLLQREISDVGRKSFGDLQAYLRSKLSLQFSNKHAALMSDLYFVRNVVAHNAGYLRKDQLASIPHGVNVVEAQIRLSREYVYSAVECLFGAVEEFHAHLLKKWKS